MKFQKYGYLGNIARNKWGLLVLALVGAIFITLMCPVWPFTDSSVFRYVAYAMQNGQIPYKDVFDHKGPLIYLINFLGLCIHKSIGVWLFEIVTLVSTICFIYKTSYLVCQKPLTSIVATFVVLLSLPQWFQGGNLTEEYAMPLIAAAVFIFTDYFIRGKVSNLRLFLCGLCGGAVLMLRPNMAVAWLVFPLAVVIYELMQKSARRIFRYGVWFTLGVAMAIIPFVIYFSSINALEDFWDAYILFNLEYSGHSAGPYNIVNSANQFMVPHIIISLIVLMIQVFSKQSRFLGITYFSFIAVSLVALSMSGRSYGHYGMILVPACAYPLAALVLLIERNKTEFLLKFSVWAAIAVMLVPAMSHFGFYSLRNVVLRDKPAQKAVVSYIKEHTEVDDKIIVVGNDNIIYLRSDRLAASKYSYQTPINTVRKSILGDFYRDLEKNVPKAVVIATQIDGIYDYLDNNAYKCTYTNDSYQVYMQAGVGE